VRNARIRKVLIVATLAALIGGCSAWTGPRAMVEDRRVEPDRSREIHVKHLSPAKAARKAAVRPGASAGAGQAAAPSFCDGPANDLIHPLHFGEHCPLLRWEIHTARDSH
jgi:hypothetical protein